MLFFVCLLFVVFDVVLIFHQRHFWFGCFKVACLSVVYFRCLFTVQVHFTGG